MDTVRGQMGYCRGVIETIFKKSAIYAGNKKQNKTKQDTISERHKEFLRWVFQQNEHH